MCRDVAAPFGARESAGTVAAKAVERNAPALPPAPSSPDLRDARMNPRSATDALSLTGETTGPLGRSSIEGTPVVVRASNGRPAPVAPIAGMAGGPREREGLLVFLLAGAMDPAHAEATIANRLDWGRLLQFAWDEGATGVLREFLRALPRGRVPLEVERQLACLALERELRMRLLEKRAGDSVAVLRAAGIDVALLKGAALAATVYGSFRARPMNDVDLMVRAERAEEAKELMLATGWEHDSTLPGDDVYATHHHLAPLIDSRGSRSRLEIHRALLPPGHPFALASEDLWRRMQRVDIGTTSALALDANQHALHIAIHFAWSHTMRAGAWHAFRDLGALEREGRLDWERLVSMAVDARAASCCYWTLLLGRAMSGLAVPDDALRALAPSIAPLLRARLERHFVHVLLRRDATHLSLRLDRRLWSMAIQPEQQGHGASRPWLVSAELTAARLRHDTASPGHRALQHVDRVARCGAYVARLLWN